MPRVKPLGRDYEKEFGAELKAAIVRKRLSSSDVANYIGFSSRTMSSRFTKPSDMTLGQLKRFVKITDLPSKIILQYLYGK